MHLKDLKQKSPKELLTQAEELGIEDASSMRVQDLIFAIMKKVASDDQTIYGEGTIEVLQDGFGFLRSAESNYLASPDDIYVSPSQVKKFGLRTGDTVEGEIRGPKDNERYFALTKSIRLTLKILKNPSCVSILTTLRRFIRPKNSILTSFAAKKTIPPALLI